MDRYTGNPTLFRSSVSAARSLMVLEPRIPSSHRECRGSVVLTIVFKGRPGLAIFIVHYQNKVVAVSPYLNTTRVTLPA